MNPNEYKLIFKVESISEKDITFNYNFTNIKIENCDENQYIINNNNNIITCENPTCHESCPVSSTAKCIIIDGNVYEKNVISRNTCKCNNGWKGENCDEKVYKDFG